MYRSVFSIIFLALVTHLCVAKIVMQTTEPEYLTHLYDAAVDIVTTCYGDLGSAVAIVGDSDGALLKKLRLKYFIPVVLIEHGGIKPHLPDNANLHKLEVFVIISTGGLDETHPTMYKLYTSKWWNRYANFLFIDATFNDKRQCTMYPSLMRLASFYGLLNAQSICYHRSSVAIFNSNRFRRQAPTVWRFVLKVRIVRDEPPLYIFGRLYRKGGQACKELNFPKTIDICGYPINFLTTEPPRIFEIGYLESQEFLNSNTDNWRKWLKYNVRRKRWFMNNIVRSLNGTGVIKPIAENTCYNCEIGKLGMGLSLKDYPMSSGTGDTKQHARSLIFRTIDVPLFAMTNYTGYMSQLDKIISIIDGTSRMGVCLVYVITFLFFKFFVGQAVMPALLNIVRLTCNTGLPSLPQNLASTIYLTVLLMFVVTLQGIFTGNLATLLTTTIAYRNVETKGDIPYLGYKLYVHKDNHAKIAGDPVLEKHIVEIPAEAQCFQYLLRESLGACVGKEDSIANQAAVYKFHVSREPIARDYIFYHITPLNPLQSRLELIMKRLHEHGLEYRNQDLESLRIQYQNDDEVKKNTDRRVMNLNDLCFAFVILGVGLSCSLICFIGEIAICKIRLKMAKRRRRVRARLAWGVKKNSFLSFPSFNFRFNVRRLFSKHR